ncbi:MAG: DUF5666 domain-containing protein [Gammaproteobacteria bacterium]|nr:DUF5666 domain-containing protein [Gammaproteobacteria bacterium]
MKTKELTIRGLAVTGLVSTLIACGGGSGSSSTSTPVVAKGVITAIGSIWVNGVEYATPSGGSYSDDDEPKATFTPDDIGKVVSLRGHRNDDGISGTAEEVEYEAEIEGAAIAGNIINGVAIITDQILTPDTRYEISGFWLNNTTIEATFIKVDNDGDGIDEIKGRVETVDPGISLTVRGNTYLYNGSTVVAEGDYVEVHFNPTLVSPNTYSANIVELEDDLMDGLIEGHEAEAEGVVSTDTTGCPTGADYVVGETCIKLDSFVEWEDGLIGSVDLINGVRVEAEGYNSGGLLISNNIKGRGNRVRITATPADNFDGTFTFFDGIITVTTSNTTDMNGLQLADLLGGTYATGVEVRGIRTDDGSVNPVVLATSIRPEDADQRNEIRAAVNLDGADESGMTITVLGITKTVDNSTQLEIEDILYTAGDATSFLTRIDDNDDTTDGPNDIVDLRFDAGSSIAAQIEIELEDD